MSLGNPGHPHYVTKKLRHHQLCHKEAQDIIIMSQRSTEHPYYVTRKLRLSFLYHYEAQGILIMSQGNSEYPYYITMKLRTILTISYAIIFNRDFSFNLFKHIETVIFQKNLILIMIKSEI